MSDHDLPRWPTVVVAEKAPVRTRVNLSRLPATDKRQAWEWIKRDEPDLAAFLKSPATQAIIKTFDGEVFIEFDETTTGG